MFDQYLTSHSDTKRSFENVMLDETSAELILGPTKRMDVYIHTLFFQKSIKI